MSYLQGSFVNSLPLPKFTLWEKFKRGDRKLVSFDLEVTARCNNNCRHCYINLPAEDKDVEKDELSLEQIKKIVDQVVDLGALWCLVTGGEPLLRGDFFDIYLYLKKKGLLVSVFTNATLINQKHIELFRKYPPRDIEVTVYGVTQETYEQVTQRQGSFNAFISGLNLLLQGGIKVRFKAMALRSNVHELKQISEFCRARTKDYFRFDPFLHLRFDGDKQRNEEIKSERLTPEEVVAIEKADNERFGALEKSCDKLIMQEAEHINCNHLFHCGTGQGSFTVSYDGFFRLCSSLWHPECVYDLKSEARSHKPEDRGQKTDDRRQKAEGRGRGTLKDAWENFVPKVRDMRSNNKEFLNKCRKCPIINLCIWCAAHSYLESGELDAPVDYFCEVAHARAKALQEKILG